MINLPNLITVVRILFIPCFIMALLHYRETGEDAFRIWAIVFFLAAGASDAIDGFIARTRNQRTQLGSFLDPLADKLLLISAVIMLSVPLGGLARLPSWFPVLVISRDAIIILGALLIHMLAGRVKPKPSLAGKFTAVFQILTVLWVLFCAPHYFLPLYLAAVFTLISGLQYISEGMRQLQERETRN